MATILVIDDDDGLRDVLRRWLEHLGHEVREASNGREGVASYRAQRSEVVLTDVFMPQEDGLGAISALRRHDPDVRIVAMSGGGFCFEADDCLSQAETLGARATLLKPFRTNELEGAIRRALAPGHAGSLG